MSLFNKKQSNIPKRRLVNREDSVVPSSDTFRRNRTLMGTTSNHLDSTNTSRDLESPRVKTHNLAKLRRKIASLFLVIVLAIILIWILVSNLTASVAINVSDSTITKPIDQTRYEKVIQEYLDTNPISRLSFFLDQSTLTSYVSSKLPEVYAVKQQNMVGIGRTSFEIRMRTPLAGWMINGKQFYVDSGGIPFDKNYYSSPVVQIVDDSGITMKSGTTAIASKRFLGFVGRAVYLAKTYGYTVTQASLPANTTRELELHLKEGGFVIKLSIDRPAGEQVEDMVKSIQYFTSHGQVPAYIDVRVSGKAFYR